MWSRVCRVLRPVVERLSVSYVNHSAFTRPPCGGPRLRFRSISVAEKSGPVVRRLSRLWRQRVDLEGRLVRGPRQIAAAEAAVAAAKKRLEEHRGKIQNSKMSADRKQLQMREREAKLYDMEVKMNMCKTDREYQTLKGQIAADQAANAVLTDEILETLEQVDALESDTDSLVSAVARNNDELSEASRRVEAERGGLENDLKVVVEQLQAVEKELTGPIKVAYDRLVLHLRAEAIVQQEDGGCSGCYAALSPQLIDRMRLDEAVVCTSCGRIVFDQR